MLDITFTEDSTTSADQRQLMPRGTLVDLERPYGFRRYVEIHISLLN